jgi:hypothetical protein
MTVPIKHPILPSPSFIVRQAGMFPHSRSSKPDKRHSVSNESKGPPSAAIPGDTHHATSAFGHPGGRAFQYRRNTTHLTLCKRATSRTPDPSALLRSMSRPSRHPPAVAVVHRPRGSLPGMQLLGFERTPPNTTAPLPPILSTVLATPQIHTHDNQTTRNHDHTPI